MASLEEIQKERLRKLNLLKEFGYEPYPAKTEITHTLKNCLSQFDKLSNESSKVTIGGRIMALRIQGALAFFDLFDGTNRLQALLKKDDVLKKFELFQDVVDIGDFVQVSGTLFVTKRGEKTIIVGDWKMLAKSLRPLPEKWVGLQDEEEKLRKRYLDILTDTETRMIVEKRSTFWQTIRQFLLERNFIEVDTPILENTPGGAEARPFVTYHNALDLDIYLRISPELWLKRLLVAGLPKIFEIGRVFRNEGIDAEHLQDYQVMEFYWAYANYEQGMKLVEELYKEIAQKTFGTLRFKIRNFEVDLSKNWECYDYLEIIKEKTGINIEKTNLGEIEKKLKELGVEYDKEGFNLNRAIDNLWKYCRRQIAGPGFLINVPAMMEPLAKRRADNPNLVERFQVILAGSENGKGFSELNDPQDQLKRFEEQDKLRVAGDEEAQRKDDDFIEALEYGMPPACGFGLSERLFSFLLDKPVREGQIFPLLKPKK
ncbi:MAG: lysine--tRNA ligase [Candidatus Paceibacterota bacterium]|jgi:lysyl-tRNA synthetase class 2